MADHPSRPVTGYPLHPPNGHPPTAYPHQAPLPSNPFYTQTPYFYPNRQSTLIRRLIISLIVLTVLFFLLLFIFWLVFHPHYPEFRVTSLSLTNFNVSTSAQRVTGNWDVRFDVYNPNKKLKVSYDAIRSSILYKSELLSETRIAPFDQGTKNLTVVEAVFSSLESYVDGWVVNGMNSDISHGSVGFDVKVFAQMAFRTGGLRLRRRALRVICEDVKVVGVNGNGGSGNFTGGPRQCLVYG